MHARDPRHRVDAIPSERHVRVEFDGELLAESRRPLALFESGLPTRWYLPAKDVRQELLEPSDMATRCPYKGAARFFSVRLVSLTETHKIVLPKPAVEHEVEYESILVEPRPPRVWRGELSFRASFTLDLLALSNPMIDPRGWPARGPAPPPGGQYGRWIQMLQLAGACAGMSSGPCWGAS